MELGILLLVGFCFYAILDIVGIKFLFYYFKKSNKDLRSLFKKRIDWLAAGLMWFLIAGGIVIFVITSVASTDLGDVFSLGMIFGLIVHGCLQASNQAILKHWNRSILMIDVVRGMITCGLISMFLRWLSMKVGIL